MISNDAVALLKALLRGDADEFDRLIEQTREHGVEEQFSTLLAAAFAEAASGRFSDPRRASEIIRYVASVRARTPTVDLDPAAAEGISLAALGNPSAINGIDEVELAHAQAHLLAELVADEQLDEPGLDEFLDKAMARAESVAD